MTISKKLRNRPGVLQRGKDKVHKAVIKIGYDEAEHVIGVVIPSFRNNFFSYAVKGIVDTAAKKKYDVFITESGENKNTERMNIESLIKMKVDGLIVCVSQETEDTQIFERIGKMNIPMMFFDRKLEGMNLPSIEFDDRNGGISALEKIIKLGYKKIAHFAGYLSVSVGKSRCEAYRFVLEKNGIEIIPEWIIEGGFDIRDGYEAFKKLYDLKDLPEIIFAVNDRVALGAYNAAYEKGINIPDDIGIVGYGFIDTAIKFYPSISIINQDPMNMGIAAATLIMEKITNPDTDIIKYIISDKKFLWNKYIEIN